MAEVTDDFNLGEAERMRIARLVLDTLRDGVSKIYKQHQDKLYNYAVIQRWSYTAFEAAIVDNMNKILKLTQIPNEEFYRQDKLTEMRAKARDELAAELKSARKRLRDLRRDIGRIEFLIEERVKAQVDVKAKERRAQYASKLLTARAALRKLETAYVNRSLDWKSFEFPRTEGGADIPLPFLFASKSGDGVPVISGIYFFWDGEDVVYVGQSMNLNQRLRLGGHHVLQKYHRISFLSCEVESLNDVEWYYIWLLRPRLNFGGRIHRAVESCNAPSV